MAGQRAACEVAAANFRRLSGHARLVGAAIVLGVKLGLAGLVGFVWFVTVEVEINTYSTFDTGTLAWLGFWSTASAILMQALLSDGRRRWIASAGMTLLCPLGYVSLVWMMRSMSMPRLPLSQALADCAAIALGGLVGHVLTSVASALCSRLSVHGGFSGLAPTLGLDPNGAGYRADIEGFLLTIERAFARELTSVRAVGVCGLALLILATATVTSQWETALYGGIALSIVTGGLLGVAVALLLMPAKRRAMLMVLPGALVVLPAAGNLLGGVMYHRASAPPLVVPMLGFIAGLAANCGYLISRFLAKPILRYVLPGPIYDHIAGPDGNTAILPSPSATSALACEICGYQLEGLPTSTCPTCSAENLRCPECGHQQPAGTLHAHTVMRMCRIHLSVRVLSWLVATGLALLLLLLWYIVGADKSGAPIFDSYTSRRVLAFAMVAFVFVTPLRLLFMHWRPILIMSLLVPALPLLAMCLGSSFSWRGGGMALLDLAVFCVIWLVVSLSAPLLWRGWLWLVFGPQSRDVWAWQTSRAFRRGDASRMIGEAHAIGKDFPAGQALSPCSACRVLHGEQAGAPVSLARIAFEGLMHRTREMLLVLIAAALAAGCAIAAIIMGTYGSQFRDMGARLLDRSELTPLVIAALGTGALVRGAMIRRRITVSALGAGTSAALWFITSFVLESYASAAKPRLVTAMCAMVMMAAFIGACSRCLH